MNKKRFLLMLPAASRDGVSCGFRPALFTATSATCVTGLVLYDTYTQWSGFGQTVIICMIEIGSDAFAETEGFGAKALEEAFVNQFIGKTCPVQAADIDAIAGATITTNAVLEALNAAYELVK